MQKLKHSENRNPIYPPQALNTIWINYLGTLQATAGEPYGKAETPVLPDFPDSTYPKNN